MIQQILVLLIFAGAVVYVVSLLYKSFRAEKGCSSGCGKCGAVDFNKISKQLKENGL